MMSKLRFSHFLLWQGDSAYRVSWFAAPQLLAILGVGFFLTRAPGTSARFQGTPPAWGVPMPPPDDPVAADALRDRAKTDPKAFEEIRARADAGNALMQFEMASLYDPTFKLSALVQPDMATAMRYYKSAAEGGNNVAQSNYGNSLAYGLNGAPRDPATGLQWVLKAANANYARAQRIAGIMYRDGVGVPVNRSDALGWFQKAAATGDHYSEAEMGAAYWEGAPPFPKDHAEAVKWYRKAAVDLTETAATRMLGIAYRDGDGIAKDLGTALVWFRSAADKGDAYAAVVIGDAYWNGTSPYTKSRSEAVKWYTKAAQDQGQIGAARMLGYAYRDGEGVSVDRGEAMRWFRIAADKGDASSSAALGDAYWNGAPFPKDHAEAVKWYRKAAADVAQSGSARMLGIAYRDGDGASADRTEAMRWFHQAAEKGDTYGAAEVGVAYFNGVAPYSMNPAEAIKWLRIAAASATEIVAQRSLGIAYIEGRGVTPDSAQARYWLEKASGAGDRESARLLKTLR